MGIATLYVGVTEGYFLQRQPGGGYLRERGYSASLGGRSLWMLTPLAEEIAILCDGTRTIRDLLQEVGQRFVGEGFSAIASAGEFLQEGLQVGFLEARPGAWAGAAPVSGSTSVFRPTHMSIELTDGCNLLCRHCYRGSSPAQSRRLPTGRILALVDEMRAAGVTSVELTGGEPTFHQDFDCILLRCAQAFDLTAILTNGTLLGPERIEMLAKHADRVVLQLDLDGSTPELHEGLRGLPGSFARALKALRDLSAVSVPVRVAMNVYPGNLHSVRETCRLALDAGARWFACNPIIDVGRASPDLLLSGEQMLHLLEVVEALAQKMPGYIVTSAEIERAATAHRGNCGAGSRSLVVEPDGKIRACVLVQTSGSAFGDVSSEAFDDVIRRAPLRHFSGMPTPSSAKCGACEFLPLCEGCILRPVLAWRRAAERYSDFGCAWDTHTRLSHLLTAVGS